MSKKTGITKINHESILLFFNNLDVYKSVFYSEHKNEFVYNNEFIKNDTIIMVSDNTRVLIKNDGTIRATKGNK